MRSVTITAGEAVTGVWCAPCNAPVAIRVPLHLDGAGGPVVADLTVCAECGTRFMPAKPVITVTQAERRRRPRPWLWMLWRLQRRDCNRRGIAPRGCAYGDCPKPGWWDCAWYEMVDEGRIRWLFCGINHRRRWLIEHGYERDHRMAVTSL